MRITFLFTLLLVVVGCSPSDPQFCECLEKGDAFNKASAEVIADSKNKQSIQELKKLKAEKEKACANYIDMSGEEMLKRKADCK